MCNQPLTYTNNEQLCNKRADILVYVSCSPVPRPLVYCISLWMQLPSVISFNDPLKRSRIISAERKIRFSGNGSTVYAYSFRVFLLPRLSLRENDFSSASTINSRLQGTFLYILSSFRELSPVAISLRGMRLIMYCSPILLEPTRFETFIDLVTPSCMRIRYYRFEQTRFRGS